MRKTILQSCFVAIVLASGIFSANAQDKAAFSSNWPEWRGLYNTGAVSGGNTPVEFSETKNVKWKVEIPGKGHATPIVWGNQIIVQTAVPTDKRWKNRIQELAARWRPTKPI